MRDFKFFREKPRPKLSDYDELGLTCIGVSPLFNNPESFEPIRYIMFTSTPVGTVVKGRQIGNGHPLFDCPEGYEWPNPVVE